MCFLKEGPDTSRLTTRKVLGKLTFGQRVRTHVTICSLDFRCTSELTSLHLRCRTYVIMRTNDLRPLFLVVQRSWFFDSTFAISR